MTPFIIGLAVLVWGVGGFAVWVSFVTERDVINPFKRFVLTFMCGPVAWMAGIFSWLLSK
jgi:hypothetical protein